MDSSDAAKPTEPDWPEVDVIVGNPPFLGSKKLRRELRDEYVDAMFEVWDGRVPREADLCCYWFEKARAQIQSGHAKRVGLLATQAIRGGKNRLILDRIVESGSIFWAESDRRWILEGAAVHVSMVGFDDGNEETRKLDGLTVTEIFTNLTSGQTDVTRAYRLKENFGLAFQGPVKVGSFDITNSNAMRMMEQPNPHGKSNAEVIQPWVNGSDITGRPRKMWIVNFADLSLESASLYESPFEYVKRVVRPQRISNRDSQRRNNWWRLGRSGTDLRNAVVTMERFIVTPRIAKHRLFVWVTGDTMPDSAVIAFARDDEYYFGVLHSRVHEVWSLQ